MDEIIFDLTDVRYSYLGKYPALCGVNMRVRAGEKLTILGANGTGKSTLLQMLDGLIFPDSGAITAFGRALNEAAFGDETFSRSFRSSVGFVFQNPEVQLFCPTVKEDIVFGPVQMGMAPDQINRRLAELGELLRIADLFERQPHQLSIGEKRKVAIASILIMQPKVIILDEPTAGLDPMTSQQIVGILLEANAGGATVITATHDLHIVGDISDAVYLLNRQRTISRYDQCEAFLNDRQLLEENNLVHAHPHRHEGKSHAHPHLHLHEEHDHHK